MAKRVNITLPNVADLNIQVKLEGAWEQVTSMTENLGNSIQKGYGVAVNKFSIALVKIVKKALTTGVPPMGGGVAWQPLAKSTLQRYGQHNIYYLTGLYARSVGVHTYKSRTLVGLPIGTRRSSQKKLTLNQLAIILEYGSKDGRIPPRPVWAPSLAAAGGKDKLKKSILTEIRRQLSKYGVRPNQVKW